MKKIILLLVITLLILSSCNNKFSLTKRHYTQGFYFTHSKNTVMLAPKLTTVTQKKANGDVTVFTVKEVSKKDEMARMYHTESSAEQTTKHKAKIFPVTKFNMTASRMDPLTTLQSSQNVGIKTISTEKMTAGGNEGRSLLWIVIIVLVILWALGIISGGLGLGILINLLLLIALILLILWFLRII